MPNFDEFNANVRRAANYSSIDAACDIPDHVIGDICAYIFHRIAAYRRHEAKVDPTVQEKPHAG